MPTTMPWAMPDRENGGNSSICAPLAVLLQAATLANRLGRSRWEFGVDGTLLIAAGLTLKQFQWLADEKYVELTEPITRQRFLFAACEETLLAQLHGKSRMVLTAKGEKAARGLCTTVAQHVVLPPNANGNGAATLVPTWDKDHHRLSMAGFLTRVFKRPAPNQELVLNSFQELGWPSFIYNPLPPRRGSNPKHRLHDTIEDLKGHQIIPLIRFYGDGSGQRIGWEPRHDVVRMLQLA